MLIHIAIPAREVLNKIAKRRVGRIMGNLDSTDCPEEVKTIIKKEIWDMKKDMEDVMEEACCYIDQPKTEKEYKNGMDKNTNGHTSEQIFGQRDPGNS